jgi:hypothetical protein
MLWQNSEIPPGDVYKQQGVRPPKTTGTPEGYAVTDSEPGKNGVYRKWGI